MSPKLEQMRKVKTAFLKQRKETKCSQTGNNVSRERLDH